MINPPSDPFSAKSRQALLALTREEEFDVLIIGGGITGAGIALDAASRGLKVALIEMQDFSGGTSSRSTRLIHGGLRYLKQLEFKLVSEVSKERDIIFRNAPHLVKPELLLLPITTTGSFGKFMTRLGMWIYEMLAGVKKEERHRILNANEALELEPLLKKENLLGGVLYYEYRTNDARLTISILKEAVNRGALALSYLKVMGLIYEQGKIMGVKTEDQFGQGSYILRSKYVINASGPWVDDVDQLDDAKQDSKLQLTKGVHLVFDHRKLPLKQAVYFDTGDKRMIFALPHSGKTYVGTTDTFYAGDKLNPGVEVDDTRYLIKSVNDYFSVNDLKPADVESSWAGIRPLIRKPGKKPSEISRKDETFVSGSGLISIAGGKLTGYRKMAQRVVDLVVKKLEGPLKKEIRSCSTDRILLSGGKTGSRDFSDFIMRAVPAGLAAGLSKEESETLINRYGSEVDRLYKIVKGLTEKEGFSGELPLSLRAELIYAIEFEMCLTPCDFFIRRTGMLYFDINTVVRHKNAVVDYMQDLLNWDKPETARHERELQQQISNATKASLPFF